MEHKKQLFYVGIDLDNNYVYIVAQTHEQALMIAYHQIDGKILRDASRFMSMHVGNCFFQLGDILYRPRTRCNHEHTSR